MNKKTVRILISAAAALLLLLAGFPLFSRLYYGRSQAATLLAWQFRKDAYTTEEAFEEYLAEKRAEQALPYLLPADSGLSAAPWQRELGGIDCLLLNPNAASRRLIVYFTGGSYIDAPRAVHWQFLNALAGDAYAAILVPFYPRLPSCDAADAYDALRDFCRELAESMHTEELIFMGDSAGGGMALSLAMQIRDQGELPGPEKLILICPWLDVTLSDPEIPVYAAKDPALDAEQLRHLGALWAGELDPTDPRISPLYGRFDGLGRITLLTGTDELLYPDIHAFDEALTAAGIDHDCIVYEGMFHVWPLYMAYGIPEAKAACADILAAVTAD